MRESAFIARAHLPYVRQAGRTHPEITGGGTCQLGAQGISGGRRVDLPSPPPAQSPTTRRRVVGSGQRGDSVDTGSGVPLQGS